MHGRVEETEWQQWQMELFTLQASDLCICGGPGIGGVNGSVQKKETACLAVATRCYTRQ